MAGPDRLGGCPAFRVVTACECSHQVERSLLQWRLAHLIDRWAGYPTLAFVLPFDSNPDFASYLRRPHPTDCSAPQLSLAARPFSLRAGLNGLVEKYATRSLLPDSDHFILLQRLDFSLLSQGLVLEAGPSRSAQMPSQAGDACHPGLASPAP